MKLYGISSVTAKIVSRFILDLWNRNSNGHVVRTPVRIYFREKIFFKNFRFIVVQEKTFENFLGHKSLIFEKDFFMKIKSSAVLKTWSFEFRKHDRNDYVHTLEQAGYF